MIVKKSRKMIIVFLDEYTQCMIPVADFTLKYSNFFHHILIGKGPCKNLKTSKSISNSIANTSRRVNGRGKTRDFFTYNCAALAIKIQLPAGRGCNVERI